MVTHTHTYSINITLSSTMCIVFLVVYRTVIICARYRLDRTRSREFKRKTVI